MDEIKGERIAYWDNLKTFLIFLVVLGHMVIPDSRPTQLLHNFIYSFHMPAFVFVSGFFSKKYIEKGAPQINKLLGYAIVFVTFQIALWLEIVLMTKKAFYPNILYIDYAPWYMFAMIIWLLILPVFAKIKPIIGISMATIISLIIPISINIDSFFALNRIIWFLPFFVVGYYFDYKMVITLRSNKYRVVSLVIMLMLAISLILARKMLGNIGGVIDAKGSYLLYEPNLQIALCDRIVCFVISILMIVILLQFCPTKKYFFTYIGSRTLAIYIIHRFITLLISNTKMNIDICNNEILWISMSILISLLIVWVCSERHISNLLNKLFKITKA